MTELRWILLGLGALLVAGIYLSGRRQAGRSIVDDTESGSGRIEPTVQGADNREWRSASSREPDVSPGETVTADLAGPMALDTGTHPRGARREPQLGTAHTAIAQNEPERFEWSSFEERAEPQVRRQRVEPTLEDAVAQIPAVASQPSRGPSAPGQSRPQRSIERRKILAFRLVAPAPERYSGQRLLEEFARLGLKHGRHGIFHRPHDGEHSVFSIASMVEPGSFDLEEMVAASYPGLTLFAVLPGPLDGASALDSVVGCARALHDTLGGALQDERGAALSAQRIAALHSEIAAFEQQLPSAGPHA